MTAPAFTLTPEQIAAARVVVVDDDPLVTSSLRSFLSLAMEIDPVIFNDSSEALFYVTRTEVDLVISDFLMPQVDGIKLLSELRKLRPEVPRVLLTGYADKESAIKAINEVQLFQYLEKPWDNEQLKNVVIGALERVVLVRTLQAKMDELSATREDLAGLKRAVVRAFA